MFSNLCRQALGDYLYHNLAATHGSGERALSRVLKPGAWAHSPLMHRLPKVDKSIPVHFIFGDRDWMDSKVYSHPLLVASCRAWALVNTPPPLPPVLC